MNILDMIDDAVSSIADKLDEEWTACSARELGLDPRADVSQMWASREGIATRGNIRSLEYYGGFEYIYKYNGDSVYKLMDLTIFTPESERVRRCLYKFLPTEEAKNLAAEYDELDDYFGEH